MPRASKKNKILQQSINETDFLVVDVETTGLSPDAGDRVCEISAVKLRGTAVIDTYCTFIDPQRPVSAGAFAVNRISPQMLSGAPLFSETAERLLKMAEDSVIVAYNAPFDTGFINSELRLAGHKPLLNPVVDALNLARQILPGLGRYPQGNVARVIGIPFPVQHRALDDAMMTVRLLMVFTTILKAHGMTTSSDLQKHNITQILISKRLDILRQAILDGGNLWIKYLSPSDAAITDRIVTPKQLVQSNTAPNQFPYLFGYCHNAQGERNFRIDRILDLRIVENNIL